MANRYTEETKKNLLLYSYSTVLKNCPFYCSHPSMLKVNVRWLCHLTPTVGWLQSPSSLRCPDLHWVSALPSFGHFPANQAWEFSIPSALSRENKKQVLWTYFYFLVKVMGIEPMSESISSGISPSAAFVLKFRVIRRPKAGSEISYPVSPLRCRAFPQGFPVCFDTWHRTYR